MAADIPEPQDAFRRYDLIEQAYRDNRWADVISAGGRLLGDLDSRRDATAMALRPRLLLLLGHTQLYGIGDAKEAERIYGDVLCGDAEVELLETAQQGLRQCRSVLPEPQDALPIETEPLPLDIDKATSSSAGAEVVTPASQPGAEGSRGTFEDGAGGRQGPPTAPFGSAAPESPMQPATERKSRSATPWLGDLTMPALATGVTDSGPARDPSTASPSGSPARPSDLHATPWTRDAPSRAQPTAPVLVPEVVEEPEVIEVHQQDPALAEEIEITLESGKGPEAGMRSGAEDRDQDLLNSLLKVVIS